MRGDRIPGFPGGPLLGFRSLPGGARPGRGNLSTARGPGPVPATDVSGGVALPGRGRAAAALRGLGPNPFFQWVDEVAFDAAVHYRDGWAAFIWVGVLRSEAGIAERIERLGRDFIALAHGHPQPRPSQVCCVVPDRWQAEMVARVARRYQMEDWISTWCIADDSWHGAVGYLESTGWVHQPPYRRDLTPPKWQNNLRNSQWSEEANRDPGALLGRVRPAILEALGDKDAGDRLVRRARGAIRKAASPQEAADRLRRFTAGLKDRGEAAGAVSWNGSRLPWTTLGLRPMRPCC